MGSSSYSAPSPSQIMAWTGINIDILDQTDAELQGKLADIRTLAEAETQADVGSSNWSAATLEAFHVTLLQEAVARRVAAQFVEDPALRVLTGTLPPLLAEDEDAFQAWIDRQRERADKLVEKIIASIEAPAEPANEGEILTGFSSDDERVFTKAMDW